MINDLFMLSQLVDIRNQRIELDKREADLLSPQLKEVKYVPVIFEYFCKLTGFNPERDRALDSDQKKEFIFIVLFLYCPKVIVYSKKRMIKGLRGAITQILGLDAPTGISNLSSEIYFWYTTYKVYRDKTDFYYDSIVEYLIEEGILEKRLPHI